LRRQPRRHAGGPRDLYSGGAAMSEGIPTIECRRLARVYRGDPAGSGVRALDRVDLTIAPGESVSVEGPSGCGKTTLLNLIGLIDTPTEGEVRWDGQPVGQRPE